MSRIGKKPISIPQGVTVTVTDSDVVVTGKNGSVTVPYMNGITVKTEDSEVLVTRSNDEIQSRANHGLIRSLLQNAVEGVTNGYKKTLKLVGTGYRVQAQGANISLAVGYSHPVIVEATPGVKLEVEGNDTIHISGIDKQQVGQVAANIRKVRPPEPYKGKGIRYSDEEVRRKQGKASVG